MNAKLVHYVSTMQNLLSMYAADQKSPSIPAAKAKEYAQQIELVA
jgi:hypothetical protein